MFSSKDLFFTPTSGAFTVSKSLRFRSGSTTYLNRTPGSAANRQQYTISFWFKRGLLNTLMNICSTNGNGFTVQFSSSTATAADTLRVWEFASGAYIYHYVTTPVYRDPSAWYHCVIAVDGTTTTFTNSVKIYINGTQVTAFSTQVNPTATFSSDWNNNVAQNIGRNLNATNNYFDGYLAEFYNVPGQLTPTDFGAYDTNGIWQPAAYTGSYGTNGFYLKFTTVGATSGSNTGYGQDFSGNGNYWTTNNFGTTSTATTYDSMLDSPTNATGDIGNYPTLNPLYFDATFNYRTLSNANLTTVGNSATNNGNDYSTQTMTTGKWYAEFTCKGVVSTTYPQVGIVATASVKNGQGQPGYVSNSCGYYADGTKGVNGTVGTAYGSSFTTNDVIAVAVDADNGAIYFGKISGGTITWQNSGVPTSGSSKTGAASTWTGGSIEFYFALAVYQSGSGWDANFGQRPFSASALPSGFSALNTQNLTTPTITNGAQYMAAVTYTGSASTQSVTATSTNSGNNPNAVTFQPDLVWIKDRTNAQSHKLTDAVRGTTKAISTDSTAAEATDANGVTAFNNDGFSLGTGTRAYSDSNLDSYIAWQWKETSTAGFDIVSYAGDNTSNRNISHNLGFEPDFVWVKSLSTGSFYIWHRSLSGNTSFLKCNSTDGTNAQTTTNTPWGTGNWSSTQFMVTNNATNNLNASSTNYIAYLWDTVSGYSAFGSYTGNNSADGPFVYLGFRPRWVMIKDTTSAGTWWLGDSSCATYNVVAASLFPNTSGAESSLYNQCDFLSNGFKWRANSANSWPNNVSGNTYIYACFAENPFKIARAR